MSGSTPWFGWLAGLVPGFWAALPAPGTHEAFLEERRCGAQLMNELCKQPGERDEELVHTLRVAYRKCQLENAQVKAVSYAQIASTYEQPSARECCAGAGWAQQRLAASYWVLHDYHCQYVQQVTEELAAAEARRPAALMVQPTLHLDLLGALQQPPPRLDMCRTCAESIQEAELRELQRAPHAQHLQQHFQARGLCPLPTTAAASGGPAAAAAALPAGGAQQGRQQQQRCGGSSDSSGGKEDAPATPTQQQQQQKQQEHATTGEEQAQQEGPAG